MTTLLLTLSCGAKEEKPDLSTDGKTFEAALRTAGDWRFIESIDTAHPYGADFERTWLVTGEAETREMLVVFDRFELESGYDYLYVSGPGGAQLTENTGTRTGTELVVQGNQVELLLRTDDSVAKWGFRASVYAKEACACQAIHRPVCGVDGNTYGNACEAACGGMQIAYNSTCNGSPWFPVGRTIESTHAYANNFDQSWSVSEGGARFVRIHFAQIDVERGYDFVTVTDSAGNVVARYTGASQDVTTPAIAGSSASVQLTSDGTVTRYGFSIDRYEVIGGCVNDNDCGSGETCNHNIQCIRAPCFSVCEASGSNAYQQVTVQELETNRANWTGRRVRLIAEPTTFGAACTRRGCSASNPCCNTCSAGFVIGQSISLRDANDQPMGCRGNECNWQDTCDPFEASESGQYDIMGVFTMDAGGQDRLLVDAYAASECQATGCSGQACTNGPNSGPITTCEVRPEYACYANAACEAQGNGHCGWTQTNALMVCIDNARSERFSATDVPMSIPDNNTTGASSRIQISASGPINQLMVSLNISHTYRGDLIVRLIAPSGQTFLLHNGEGGSTHDLIFTDQAVAAASGVERSGFWTLQAVDRAARDTGMITSWDLAFR